MSVEVTMGPNQYKVPELNNDSTEIWKSCSEYLVAIASETLHSGNANFTLTSELGFGNSFGLKALYLKSNSANVSGIGVIRLSHSDLISWRNASNNGDLGLTVGPDDRLSFNGNKLATVAETQGGSPTTTQGDIIVRGASEDVRLPIGTANQVLKSDGTNVSWGPVTSTDSSPTTTQGDLIFRGAAEDERLAVGSADTILLSNGTIPVWFNPISGIANLAANYTVLDDDGIHKFIYTLGGSDRTLTLPTLADNIGREMIVVIVDANDFTHVLTLDGEGSEKIDGNDTFDLLGSGSSVTLIGTANGWITTSWQGYMSFNRNIPTPTINVPGTATLDASAFKAVGNSVNIKGTKNFFNEFRYQSFEVTHVGNVTTTIVDFNVGANIILPSNGLLYLDYYEEIESQTTHGATGKRKSADPTENFIEITQEHDSKTVVVFSGCLSFISTEKPIWA